MNKSQDFVQDLKSKVTNTIADVTNLRQLRDNLQNALKDLEAKLDKSTATVKDLSEKNAQAESDNTKLKADIQTLQESEASAKGALKEAQTLIADLNGQIEKLKQ